MTDPQSAFPLKGVIGIVDSSTSQLDLAKQFGLKCVEIRADLLNSSAQMSSREVLSVVSAAKDIGLACLYTLRHADQGGTFDGSEDERIAHCKQALDAGADIIDLEFGTNASIAMLERKVPIILSYHNFESMLTADELAELSTKMEAQNPAAVKIIPTGQSLADAAMMMAWVGGAGSRIKRIGFSMGDDGSYGRILALSCGSPVTYASFGAPVAPGQVDINQLMGRYKCASMTASSKVIAVIGDGDIGDIDDGDVCVAFSVTDAPTVEKWQKELNISDIIYL